MKRFKNKNIKGFTLIECLIALALLSIIVISLLPSLNNIYKIDKKSKKDVRLIYALEEAVERGKSMQVGQSEIRVNNFVIEVNISDYGDGLKLIQASSDGYYLDFVK